LRLRTSGATLAVVAAAGPVARIDTRTFRLQPPGVSPQPARAESGGLPVLPVGLVVLLVAIGAGGFVAMRRRHAACS
jgi:hypothetical protein